MKADVGVFCEVLSRDGESICACVKQMEMADLRCDHHGPAAAAASNVDAYRIGWQFIPWKNMKIRLKDRLTIHRRKFGLVLSEGRPFVAETGRDIGIDISRDVVHRNLFRAVNAQNEPVFMGCRRVRSSCSTCCRPSR